MRPIIWSTDDVGRAERVNKKETVGLIQTAADEAFRMGLIDDVEDGLPFRDLLISLTVMDSGRS